MLTHKPFLHVFKTHILKTHHDLKNLISNNYNNSNMGIMAAQAFSHSIDQIVIALFKRYFHNMQHHIALIAVGGYGRRELAPFSDLDLCLVTLDKSDALNENIRQFLYDLWDLNFKLGHTTGTADQIIMLCNQDIIYRTAILERRFLAGSPEIYTLLSGQYITLQSQTLHAFVTEKIQERTQRYTKIKPDNFDIKNGKGGLRDVHTVKWIATYTNKPLSQKHINVIKKAEPFLWAIRFILHFKHNKAQEKINMEAQKSCASLLCYPSTEEFMQHYFDITQQVQSMTDYFIEQLTV
ncbi:MAG: [protein-PII] uridylyltransferase [Alphaproteobacteria bacterium]|jgi:[protein-PII] uridylyltransferase